MLLKFLCLLFIFYFMQVLTERCQRRFKRTEASAIASPTTETIPAQDFNFLK